MKMRNQTDNKQQNSSTIALVGRFVRGSIGFIVVVSVLYFIDLFSYLIPPFIQQVYTDNIITHKNPEWFTPLIIIYILFRIGQKRRFERFAHIEMRENLVPSYSKRRANFKFVIFLLLIACAILALANLQSGS